MELEKCARWLDDLLVWGGLRWDVLLGLKVRCGRWRLWARNARSGGGGKRCSVGTVSCGDGAVNL